MRANPVEPLLIGIVFVDLERGYEGWRFRCRICATFGRWVAECDEAVRFATAHVTSAHPGGAD